VPSAAQQILELEAKAKQEARRQGHRVISMAESHAISVLVDLVRDFAPEIMSIFDRWKTSYSVAKTEAILGELKQTRTYRSQEVFLAESVFEADFAEAVAIFLHEHAHIFGRDGSRGFTDALTELLETLIRLRAQLNDYEQKWDTARQRVVAERELDERQAHLDYKSLLVSMSESELRTLFQELPPAYLEPILRRRQSRG
jgi:hypothetical protein